MKLLPFLLLSTNKIGPPNHHPGVWHTHRGLAIYIKKMYLKAKEDLLWKLKYFIMQKNIIFKKNIL
jgi:hypothetical protein